MKAEALNPETGEQVSVELSDEQVSQLDDLGEDRVSEAKILSYIDNLDISADAKAIISSIMRTTIRIGQVLINIGRRIIEIVLVLSSKFPNTTFGLILGIIIALLVGSIPIIGAIFGSLLMPISIAFGLVAGYMDDRRDQALDRKIQEAASMFSPLKGAA